MSAGGSMSFIQRLAYPFRWLLGTQACLCLVMAAAGADAVQPVKSEGSTSLRVQLATGSEVTVFMTQMKVEGSYPYKDAYMWGGDVGEPPQFALASVQIVSDGETIPLPLSAYADLGDVRFASVDKAAHGFTLSLHGGDAAAAYDATLSFSQGTLASRVVSLREFPEQRQDKTRYSFPHH